MTSAPDVHEERSGPCVACAGTGDVLRVGSGLTYRMCPTCGGTGTTDHQSTPSDTYVSAPAGPAR